MIDPVRNEDIFRDDSKNEIKEFLKKNWKNILIIVMVILNIFSYIFGWSGYSLVVGFKSGNAKANLEFHDMCMDTTDEFSNLDVSTFTPKVPKYFVIHCTGSSKDQTELDLWRVFKQRFKNGKSGYHYAVNYKGDVFSMCPIDNSPYLEWGEVVNGVALMNSVCISVAYTGGRDYDTMTPEQLNTIRYMYLRFKQQFPNLILTTHRELISKDLNKNGKIDDNEAVKMCPQFNSSKYFF